MGVLRIETTGSFPYQAKVFGAIDHGHAHAVAQAIEWLSSEVLPAAIAQDHRLHESGAKPAHDFHRPGATCGYRPGGPFGPPLTDPDGGRRGD